MTRSSIDVDVWDCPNCGSTDFVEIAPHERQCQYCGSVLTSPSKLDLVKCPRCGFDNQRGVRYCDQCGLAIAKWMFGEKPRTDPALISIIVTVAGFFVFPIGGAILGLILGYKARDQARATGGMSGSEDLARTAIIVGWVVLVIGVLPVCLFTLALGMFEGLSSF